VNGNSSLPIPGVPGESLRQTVRVRKAIPSWTTCAPTWLPVSARQRFQGSAGKLPKEQQKKLEKLLQTPPDPNLDPAEQKSSKRLFFRSLPPNAVMGLLPATREAQDRNLKGRFEDLWDDGFKNWTNPSTPSGRLC